MRNYLKQFARCAVLSIFGLSMLGTASSSGSEPRAVHTGESAQAVFASWMRWIPDSTLISVISTPGTHDTMSRYGGPGVVNNTLTLREQLRAGIRTLDIRGRHVENRFLIFHGPVYQWVTFADVLETCNQFLAENPSETILIWLSDSGVNGSISCTRSYWDTFRWYRDQSTAGAKIYRTPSGFSIDDAELGQVRGKILMITGKNAEDQRCSGCGIDDSNIDQNDSGATPTAFDMPEKWAAILAQAITADVGFEGRIYENSSTGSSGGVYAIDLANGLLGYEGMNYRYLKYLFAGNQRRTTGLFYMDFPGSGLISAILAHNLKYATNLSLIGADFGKILNEISYSATESGADGPADHALQLRHFLNNVRPNEHWTTLVSKDPGPLNWGVSSDSEGIFAQTYNIDGYTHFAVSARTLNATVSANQLNGYFTAATLAPLSGDAVARAHGAKNLLKNHFPQARWHVAVKQFPFDTSRWASQIDAAVMAFVPVFDDGSSYLYTAWATSASNRPPVIATSAPSAVNEGVEVTIKADDTRDPDGDALQYRWDFDGDGTWDTEYLPGPYITHTFADNSDYSPYIEAFDGIAAVSHKIGLIVENVAPTVDVESAVALGSNSRLTRELRIKDPGADSWRVAIDYGDGSGRLDLNLGTNRTFFVEHQFAPNRVYNVRIEARDDEEATAMTQFRVVTSVPTLEIKTVNGGTARFSWTNHPAVFQLQRSSFPDVAAWQTITNTPTLLNGRNQIDLPFSSGANHFFRLRMP